MNILIRLSLLSLGAVLALSCGKSPPSAPTIDKNKGPQEIQDFIERWDDGLKIADAAPRIALAEPITRLQELRREFEPFEVGRCIQVAKGMLKRSMDLSIEGCLGRMSGAEPGVMSESKIDTGKHLFEGGGSLVSTLIGAFGGVVRETRLTALLGYLIALEPKPYLQLFGFPGKATNVRIEHRHGNDRSDILVETTRGLGVVEAKVGPTDPFEQAKKYNAHWTVLLTQYMPSTSQKMMRGTRYIRWQELIPLLRASARSQNNRVRFVSGDLLDYLEERRMVKQRQSVEVYAREINEPLTLALFLKARLYGCNYEANSRLSEALYFAPHFGQTIARTPGVRAGISYVARIEQVELVESWSDFFVAVKKIRGKTWWNSHQNELEPLQNAPKWLWSANPKYSFLFLATPRLVFNPPVDKKRLQTGHGWLSKRTFSFDTLFEAWGC
jgi:hypothetical protein